jgi:hypothetical protein
MKERTQSGARGIVSARVSTGDVARQSRCGVRCTPYRAILLCACALFLIAGCGEKEPPSVKQSRAIAAENIELEKEVDRSNARFENLKKQYDKELEKQRDLFDKCKEERDQWKAKSQQNVRDQVEGVLDSVMADNARLREENAKLKTQIAELQK